MILLSGKNNTNSCPIVERGQLQQRQRLVHCHPMFPIRNKMMFISTIVLLLLSSFHPFVVVAANNTSSSLSSLSKLFASKNGSSKNSTMLIVPPSIVGYKLWYKSGIRDVNQEMYSPRNHMPQTISDGYYLCYEDYGDNIEGIISSNTSNMRIKSVSFELRRRRKDQTQKNEMIAKRVERAAPYFVFGNKIESSNSNIFGRTLARGKYQLSTVIEYTTVLNTNKTNTTQPYLKTNETTIHFDIIDCAYFDPPNECHWCGKDPTISGATTAMGMDTSISQTEKVCLGSSCVSTGYLRLSLVYTGDPFYDLAMTVTTPNQKQIGAYPVSYYYNNNDIPTYDDDSLGYVDENTFEINSCKEVGVFVKNIVFPAQERVPVGNYTITLSDVNVCNFWDSSSNTPSSVKPFEIHIFVQNQLVASYTNEDGRNFTYQLS